MSRPKTDRIDDFMDALNNYVDAKIREKISNRDRDSMGQTFELRQLKKALSDLLP